MILLALDPSTDVTGVAVVTFAHDETRVLEVESFDATEAIGKKTTFEARLTRIRWTRQELARFVNDLPYALDAVAYEQDTNRGHAATEAMQMAAGAYLSLSRFDRLPIYPVTRQAGCLAARCYAIYREPRGATAALQAAKKARLKGAVIAWANATFGLDLAPDQDAIADALSVAVAAHNAQRTIDAVVRPLLGPGSRGPRAKKVVAA